jgi:purine-nucleoside phosphorylase
MSDFSTLQHACQERRPIAFVVLGSGLGDVGQRLANPVSVGFSQVPGLPASSVVGHKGCLTLGDWQGRPVLLCEGRVHYYEGHPWPVVTRLIEVAAELGVRIALLTNAAGGIRADLSPGSLMAIRDHLCWLAPNPWRLPGPGSPAGERPSSYDPGLSRIVQEAGRSVGVELAVGVYAALTGPSYETPAEIRALKVWGADAVGMSTAREIEAGVDRGLRCAAVSCITNKAAGLSPSPLSHEEVLITARAQAVRLERLLGAVLARVADVGQDSNPDNWLSGSAS